MAKGKAVVVGGLGMIGRNIIQALEAEGGWDIVGLSRRPANFETGATFISVDLLDKAQAREKLGRTYRRHPHLLRRAFRRRGGRERGGQPRARGQLGRRDRAQLARAGARAPGAGRQVLRRPPRPAQDAVQGDRPAPPAAQLLLQPAGLHHRPARGQVLALHHAEARGGGRLRRGHPAQHRVAGGRLCQRVPGDGRAAQLSGAGGGVHGLQQVRRCPAARPLRRLGRPESRLRRRGLQRDQRVRHALVQPVAAVHRSISAAGRGSSCR